MGRQTKLSKDALSFKLFQTIIHDDQQSIDQLVYKVANLNFEVII